MKISSAKFVPFAKNNDASSRVNSAVKYDRRINKNFDEINIRTISSGASDESFVNDLVQRISAEVKSPASPMKLNDIHNQIEQNIYQVNLDEIAHKILLIS